MKEEFDFVELFGGICGFRFGFEAAGWKFRNHYYSEIDKHAIAATKYNYKNTIHLGPVEHITGSQLSRNAVFAFGSPCQDFSIAGKRAGMEGERSSLIGQAIRLIDECRPPLFVWENVKGAYSSNEGRDFQAILREFANLGGYRLEWQLLNTDWVLPQNRERIYLIGHLAGRSWPGVFPFTENDGLFNPQEQPNGGRPQTKYYSTTLNASSAKMVASDTYIETLKVLQKTGGYGVTENNNKTGCLQSGGANVMDKVPNIVVETATLRTHKDGEGFRKMKGGNIPALNARARQDGSQQPIIKIQPVLTVDRKEKRQNGRRFKNEGDPVFTLNCQDQHGIMITTNTTAGFDVANEGDSINLAVPTSKTRRGRVGKAKAQTLDCASNQAVVVSHYGHDNKEPKFSEKAPTLKAESHGHEPMVIVSGLTMERTEKGKKLRKDYEKGKIKHGFNEHRQPATRKDGNTNTLDTNQKSQMIVQKATIRRLTEIECERLQGFPDDWTRYGVYLDKTGKEVTREIPKPQRYKLCGNAVTTKIVELLAIRLKNCLITENN